MLALPFANVPRDRAAHHGVQRVAGAEVELEVQRLRERLIELQTRFEAGAQRDELGMRFDVVAQMMAKLTSANDKLQRTFVQGGQRTTQISIRRASECL